MTHPCFSQARYWFDVFLYNAMSGTQLYSLIQVYICQNLPICWDKEACICRCHMRTLPRSLGAHLGDLLQTDPWQLVKLLEIWARSGTALTPVWDKSYILGGLALNPICHRSLKASRLLNSSQTFWFKNTFLISRSGCILCAWRMPFPSALEQART